MQTFNGTIVSVSMKDTVKVEIPYSFRHPKYLKVLKRKTNLLAHTEMEGLKIGDKVKIVKTKPYSKNKHFKVTEVIK